MLRPGLVSVTFRKLTPQDIVALVRRAGAWGIEWGGDVHVPHGDLTRAREVRELTTETGLAVAAYGSYYRVGQSEGDGLPFERVLDTALELGAPTIRVWAGTAGSGATDAATRARIVAELQRIAALAARGGVRVALEFHGGTLTDDNESAVKLFAEASHPNLRTYWQPLLGFDDATCLAGLRALAPRLDHVHAYQWATAQDRRPLAEGAARWAEFLRVAAAVPGDRGVLLEFVAGDAPENFLRDTATLKAWLEVANAGSSVG